MMRTMYHKCKLVHADLSEYNLLYHKSKVWVIDVSQAVEHDHPKALEFLRKDCQCITYFFGGIDNCMTTRDLFDFVTDVTIMDDGVDKYIEKLETIIAARGPDYVDKEDYVFKNSYIPRTLHQVKAPIDEIFEEGSDIYHRAVTGTKDLQNNQQEVEEGEEEEELSEGEDYEDEEEEEQ